MSPPRSEAPRGTRARPAPAPPKAQTRREVLRAIRFAPSSRRPDTEPGIRSERTGQAFFAWPLGRTLTKSDHSVGRSFQAGAPWALQSAVFATACAGAKMAS
jgi:hypothetical protein